LRIATLNIWGRFADWPRRRALLAELLPALRCGKRRRSPARLGRHSLAERLLEQAADELRALLGDTLRAPRRGKIRELCSRRYPELN